jgi:hypothetical protein
VSKIGTYVIWLDVRGICQQEMLNVNSMGSNGGFPAIFAIFEHLFVEKDSGEKYHPN